MQEVVDVKNRPDFDYMFFWVLSVKLSISPEFSTNSYLVPIEISTKLSTNIKLHHRSLFFHKNYVFDKYLWHNYDQNGLVYASDLSYLYFNDSLFTMKIGRDCVHDSSTAKIFGLKDSPDSPALDQVTITMKMKNILILKLEL